MRKKVDIAGQKIDNMSYDEVLHSIGNIVSRDRKVYIVTVNPEMMLNACHDELFFDVLTKAEILTPDGVGMLWAAYFLSRPKRHNSIQRFFQLIGSLVSIALAPRRIRTVLKDRVTGADLFPKIVDYSQSKNWKIFLLGSEKGIAKKAMARLSSLYPEAEFVGCYSGTPHHHEEDEICGLINKSQPDILFVAYGSPDQEFWICRNLFKLDSVKLAIGVGGAFDFYAGKIKRAPKWMQKAGLEWCWRFLRQPSRIKRIWNATFRFVGLIYDEKNKRKLNNLL